MSQMGYEEVYEDIYRINVPLAGSPLKTLNAYLIRGGERNLLVDTGFDHPQAEAALFGALEALDSPLEKTDVFMTHVHVDHSGLTFKMLCPQNQLYGSERDAEYIDHLPGYGEELLETCFLLGIPLERTLTYNDHAGSTCGPKSKPKFTYIHEPHTLRVGRYSLQVIDLPGHTPGHLGLYEPAHRLLFSGDHVLDNISPNIVVWDDEIDYIQTFVNSLRRVRAMEVDYLFPGHRVIITDHRRRIDELIVHHRRRLAEAYDAVLAGNETIYHVTGHVSWDFHGGRVDLFPPEQLWFASSEAYAHVEHLRWIGLVSRTDIGGVYHYRLAGNKNEKGVITL